jgi:hypothetical protein
MTVFRAVLSWSAFSIGRLSVGILYVIFAALSVYISYVVSHFFLILIRLSRLEREQLADILATMKQLGWWNW